MVILYLHFLSEDQRRSLFCFTAFFCLCDSVLSIFGLAGRPIRKGREHLQSICVLDGNPRRPWRRFMIVSRRPQLPAAAAAAVQADIGGDQRPFWGK